MANRQVDIPALKYTPLIDEQNAVGLVEIHGQLRASDQGYRTYHFTPTALYGLASPFLLVPSREQSVIMPISFALKYTPGVVPYSTNESLVVYWGDTDDPYFNLNKSSGPPLFDTDPHVYIIEQFAGIAQLSNDPINMLDLTTFVGKSLFLKTGTAMTDGDGELDLSMLYRLI